MRHRGNEHQQGVPPPPPHGADLMSPRVALPQRPRLPILLTDNGSHHTDTALWPCRVPARPAAMEHTRHALLGQDAHRRGAGVPANKWMHLTGHCVGHDRHRSPAGDPCVRRARDGIATLGWEGTEANHAAEQRGNRRSHPSRGNQRRAVLFPEIVLPTSARQSCNGTDRRVPGVPPATDTSAALWLWRMALPFRCFRGSRCLARTATGVGRSCLRTRGCT